MDFIRHALHALFDVQGLIQYGGMTLICLVIFAETGFFALLPGDSLLVVAGLMAATPEGTVGHLSLPWLLVLPALCAVAGDQFGYVVGRWVGPPLYRWKDKYFLGIPIFKHDYLVLTEKLYKNYGVATIVLARFVPFARTFAPVLAGVGKMKYRTFVSFNVIGGISWVWSMVLIGFAIIPALNRIIPGFDVVKHIEGLVLAVVFLSLLPALYHVASEKRKTRKAVSTKSRAPKKIRS